LTDISFKHSGGDEYVSRVIETDNQTARTKGSHPYHQLRLSTGDATLHNDGSDTETVTVAVVNGLQLVRGTVPDTLSYDGEVLINIEGAETTKTLTDGSVSFDISTSKPAGAEITVRAVGLNDHPAESDTASIEVIQ
jgi:hypothetical protein